MAGAHLSDYILNVSTKVESAFGAGLVAADFNRSYRLSEEDVNETFAMEDTYTCGGEFATGQEILAANASLSFSLPLYPDSGAWIAHKLTGGGTGYAVTGSGDPYTHTFKHIPAGSYQQKSFSIIRYDDGRAVYHEFKGGIITNGEISGQDSGDRRIKVTGSMAFDGSRTAVTPYTPPACVQEHPYRWSGAAFSLGPFGGSAVSGLTIKTFKYTWNNNPESDDDVARTGLYASERERGDRVITAEVGLLLDQGETVDGWLAANQAVFFNTVLTNATANRVFSIFMEDAVVKSIAYSRVTNVKKRLGTVRLQGIADLTSSTTISKTPGYFTVQNGTATYEA